MFNGASDGNSYKIERLQKIIGKQAIQIEPLKNGGAPGRKVEAVRESKESRYTVKDVCESLGVSRSGYYASFRVERVQCVSQESLKDGDLLERIKAIKAEHPFWGYRMVRA